MTAKLEVVGLGALNVDHIYRVESIHTDGESMVEEVYTSLGGSAANTIFGLARLGVSAGFCGVVGDDDGGRMAIEDFARVGVDTSRIRRLSGAETGFAVCLSDRSGKRSIYLLPGANSLLGKDEIDAEYIDRAGMLHLSSFAGQEQLETLIALMDRLSASTRLSFAPGALYAERGLGSLTPIIARTQTLFVNRDEIRALGGDNVAGAASKCIRAGCRTVVVTMGCGGKVKLARGGAWKEVDAACYLRSADEEEVIGPVPGDMPGRDSTGAGDAFAAGFIYGMLGKKDMKDCGRLGVAAALCSMRDMGARAGLPNCEELMDYYQWLQLRE